MTTRRHLALAVATLALGACSTFTDNDVVAKVGDAELTNDDLRILAGDLDTMQADDARGVISAFVIAELLTADLEVLGVEVDVPDTAEVTSAQALLTRRQALVDSWTRVDPARLLDDDLRAAYEAGPRATGIACVSHILLASSDEADEVLAALDAGADFAALAGAVSLDPSAQTGGFVGCGPGESFRNFLGSEFADVVRSSVLGEPAGPVETEFGVHVIRRLPTDELPPSAAIQLRVDAFEDRFDIWIDPRFGEWNPSGLIVPTS